MIDFEKLAKNVEKLEKAAGTVGEVEKRKQEELDAKTVDAARQAMKNFVVTARDILTMFLKDRKEQIRPGHLFRDAAAKSIVPGDAADRGDALLVRWGGNVTPTDPHSVHEDAIKLSALAGKLVPVLKAYKKEEPPKA